MDMIKMVGTNTDNLISERKILQDERVRLVHEIDRVSWAISEITAELKRRHAAIPVPSP